MLNKLIVFNFYHFKDPYTLNLKGKKRVLLVGPKGSGKTSLGFALSNPFFYFSFREGKKETPQYIKVPNTFDDARFLFQFSTPSGEITYRYSVDEDGGMNTEQIGVGKETVLYRNMFRRGRVYLKRSFARLNTDFLIAVGYFSTALYVILGYSGLFDFETVTDIYAFFFGICYLDPLSAKDDRLIEKRFSRSKESFNAFFEVLRRNGYPYDSFTLGKSKIFLHDPERGDIRFFKQAPEDVIRLLRLFFALYGRRYDPSLLFVDDFDLAFDGHAKEAALSLLLKAPTKQVIIASKKNIEAKGFTAMKL